MKRSLSNTRKGLLAATLSLIICASVVFSGVPAVPTAAVNEAVPDAVSYSAPDAAVPSEADTNRSEAASLRELSELSEPSELSFSEQAVKTAEPAAQPSETPSTEAVDAPLPSAADADKPAAEPTGLSEEEPLSSEPSVKKLPAVSGDGNFVVYFRKTENWDTVYIHFWGTGSDSDWPGNKMTYNQAMGLYSAELHSKPTGIIFNDGSGNQTEDIVDVKDGDGKIQTVNIVNGNIYQYNAEVNQCNTGEPAVYYTVYFKAPVGTTWARMYTWDGEDLYSGVWSSCTKLSLDSNTGMYTGKVNVNASHIIFRYGDDSSEKQTNDYSVSASDNGKYYLHNAAADSHSTGIRPDEQTTTILAKTGTIRDTSVSEDDKNNNRSYDKFSKLSSIESLVYTDNGQSVDPSNYKNSWGYNKQNGQDTEYRLAIAEDVQLGRPIRYTVRIKEGYRTKYYVKAFNINGKTYNVIDQSEADTVDGLYSCDFMLTHYDVGPIEITPIYYYIVDPGREDDYVTFSVEDFSGKVKEEWGNTVACYAYYQNGIDISVAGDEAKNSMGGYPGQPMVYINGSYYMQLPKTINGGQYAIEGITLNNFAWDDIHMRKLLGLEVSKSNVASVDTSQVSQINCQTYDYDNFSALRDTRNANRIIFNFKFREYNRNDTTSSQPTKGNVPPTGDSADLSFVTGKDGNGWDVLVDYYDVPVDLFERRILKSVSGYNTQYYSSSEVSGYNQANTPSLAEPVYVVSDGYVAYYGKEDNSANKNKYVGQYATRWYVYTKNTNGTFKFIGALPPSALLTGLNNPNTLAKVYDPGRTDISEANFLKYGNAKSAGENNSFSTWSDYEKIYKACAGHPVLITYESNIYADGVETETGSGSKGTDKQPARRCDGRWYYSKPNNVISAQTKIVIRSSDGNNGYTYEYDQYGNEGGNATNIGVKTNAKACLVNTTLDAFGHSYNGLTSTTVYENPNDRFKFKADATSLGDDGQDNSVKYRFVGWYLETGSSLFNDITENIYGERQMDSFANLVAMYEKVEPAPTRTLVIRHDTYSDYYDSADPTPSARPGNGTGTPYIDSVIVKDGDTVIYTDYKKTNGSVVVPANKLTRDSYTVEITLSAEPDNSDTLLSKVLNEDLTASNAVSNNKVTYTYTVSQLFDTNLSSPKLLTSSGNYIRELDFYSDFTTQMLRVDFKYYDRNISAVNEPETISPTETTVPVYASARGSNEGDTPTILNAIINALGSPSNGAEGAPTVITSIGNDVCDYYFWAKQSDAVAGVKQLRNYHSRISDSQQSEGETNYLVSDELFNKYEDGYTDKQLQNHFDCFGNPNDTNNSAWVTYTTLDGNVTAYNGETDVDLSTVDHITVWGYNSPKKYKVTVSKPDVSNKAVTWKEPDANGISFADSNSTAQINDISVFYNQRLCDTETNEGSTSANNNSDFLAQYGLPTNVGFADEVTAPAELGNKVFDGWYNAKDGSKITADIKYGYRITADLDLVAGYRDKPEPESPVDVQVGVSLSNSEVGTYIDGSGVNRVRLVTSVNVFNNLNDEGIQIESDTNIKKLTAVYVQLPTRTANGQAIIWNSERIAALGLDSVSGEGAQTQTVKDIVKAYIDSSDFRENQTIKGSLPIVIKVDDVEYQKNMISYTYTVTQQDPTESTVTLTNKNRIQITLPMKAELYTGVQNGETLVPGTNSAIIAYAAIVYQKDGQEAEWILSDNHAEFISSACLPAQGSE